jgi:hypothetical protein
MFLLNFAVQIFKEKNIFQQRKGQQKIIKMFFIHIYYFSKIPVKSSITTKYSCFYMNFKIQIFEKLCYKSWTKHNLNKIIQVQLQKGFNPIIRTRVH